LRGTPFDVFGMSGERKAERRMIGEYEATVAGLLEHLDGENRKLAVEIASVPEHIRGFGHVKRRHLDEAKKKEAVLLAAFRASRPGTAFAAASACGRTSTAARCRGPDSCSASTRAAAAAA